MVRSFQKLLLLHGALGSKKQFEPVLGLLAVDFEIFTLNFEGHGGRASSNDFSIQLFSDNLIQFLNEHHIDKVDILGYSMGGYVALYTALNHPTKIGKIVTLGTKFNWDEPSTAREVKMLNPDVIAEKVPHFAAKLESEHAPLDWKLVVKKTAEMMLDLSKGKALVAEDIKKIENEVIIGLGAEDQMVTEEESENVVKLLKKGRMVRLEGAPHPIEKVDPNQLADFIRNALK